jgi:hypothetical protein
MHHRRSSTSTLAVQSAHCKPLYSTIILNGIDGEANAASAAAQWSNRHPRLHLHLAALC